MADCFEVVDVFGDTVCLSENRWRGHVLAAHPEMGPYLAEIQEAIVNPQCVYRSDVDPSSKLFYRRGTAQGRYKHVYVKVVVSYARQPAEVKTAFFATGLTGGTLVWMRYP